MDAVVPAVQPSAVQSPAVQQPNYILPNARDRWMATNLHYYKPHRIEQIARSAMSGNLIAQWQMFDLMEQTWPRLVKNLNELKHAVIDLDWNLQAYAPKGQKPSKEAQRRAAIIDMILRDMLPEEESNENDFDDTLYDAMDAVGKGISILEICWEQKDITLNLKGTDAQMMQMVFKPRATKWVHPRYYGYPPYGAGPDKLMLFTPELKNSNPDLVNDANFKPLYVPIPKDDFIVSIIKQKTGHPLNASMLRVLGFFWAAQNFTWEWFINLAQIFGAPIRWATYDPTQKNLLELVSKMLQQMGSLGYAAMPEGTKLELKEGIQSARDNPQKVLIDMADQIADILILGQTLTTSQGERGSQALGKVHKDVRDEKIQAVATRVAKTLSRRLIRAICRKNFGNDSECPVLVPAQKQAKAAIENAQRDQILLTVPGVRFGRQWFYDRHDIPVPEDDEDTIQGAVNSMDEPKPPGEPSVNDTATARARRIDPLETLTNKTLENLTQVQHRWLGSLKPEFRALLAAAKNGDISDQQLIRTMDRAKKHFPELFAKLDTASLQEAMEKAMGAAAINGAVAGTVTRRAA
jgi:phage gp29-like protein